MNVTEDEDDASKRFLELSRFWVQSVLVPIVVVVGVIGNLITVIILTRKRMKCSTNVYLTALAIADLIYLLFVLILSFEHYEAIHGVKYSLYWRFYGITHWLVDAASYVSIWLTVSFTVERYIAVCHPIRGKVLCTENRAKRVIAAVCVLCLLSTASTSFEYQMQYNTETREYTEPCSISEPEDMDDLTNQTLLETSSMSSILLSETFESNCTQTKNATIATITIVATQLGMNEVYRTVFYWFTCIIFVFVPLLLLATFNCFLISAVHRSQKQRHKMTNSQERNSATQENRITVILIAVVILFLICQSPAAGMLIYRTLHDVNGRRQENIILGLGNLFNLLVNLNAACNFLLYCALSDKYRRTLKAVLFRRGKYWWWCFGEGDAAHRSYRGDTLMYTSSMMSRRYHHPSHPTLHHTTISNLADCEVHYNLTTTTENGQLLKRNPSAYPLRNNDEPRVKPMTRSRSMISK